MILEVSKKIGPIEPIVGHNPMWNLNYALSYGDKLLHVCTSYCVDNFNIYNDKLLLYFKLRLSFQIVDSMKQNPHFYLESVSFGQYHNFWILASF